MSSPILEDEERVIVEMCLGLGNASFNPSSEGLTIAAHVSRICFAAIKGMHRPTLLRALGMNLTYHGTNRCWIEPQSGER